MKAETVNRSTVKEFGLFAILLFAALVLWHGGVIFGSLVLCGGDQVNHIIPLRMIQEKWGWFTGWDPYTFGGRPLLNDIQVGAYYPLNWLHWLGASIERTMSLLAMLHLCIGAFGFFTFLRARSSFAAAAVTGFLTIRFLLRYLQSNTFYPFVIYVWIIGAATIVRALMLR